MKRLLILALFVAGCSSVADVPQVEYFEPRCTSHFENYVFSDSLAATGVYEGDTLDNFGFRQMPDKPFNPDGGIRDSMERRIITLRGVLRSVVGEESRGMVRLVVGHSRDGSTVVLAYTPDPDCAASSPFAPQMRNVKDSLESWYGRVEKDNPFSMTDSVEVRGLAFWHDHEWKLSPVLSIKRF
jgi:hypothetical protein